MVDEDELNVKLIEDDIKDLALDPPQVVYSVRLEKWTFHSIKVLNLKFMTLEGRINKMDIKSGKKETIIEQQVNREIVVELNKRKEKVEKTTKEMLSKCCGFFGFLMDCLNRVLNVIKQRKEVKVALDLEELDRNEEDDGLRKQTDSNTKK